MKKACDNRFFTTPTFARDAPRDDICVSTILMTNTPAHPSSLPRPASKPVPHISTIPQVAAGPRIPARRLLRKVLLVLAGIAIGALGVRFFPHKESSPVPASELGNPVRPGPWGELHTVPFVITAPDELLPVRAIESGGTHWLFKNSTVSEISHLLEAADMPAAQREALLAPAVAQVKGIDLELAPTPDMVSALPEKAREALYRRLAQFRENSSAFFFIHKDTLDTRFDESGVSADTLALFHRFSCKHGDYLVFGGLPAMLAQLPSYEEKVRFMKALTRQKTMLIRVRLTKDSDVRALTDYWGKGVWAPNIRTILEGVERVPGSTFMSIIPLLPPLPASQIYFYPIVQSNPLNGPPPVHDCHWTSLNFFRDTADTRAVTPETFTEELAANYFPITGDPRYGDVLILATPSGEILHSAVFIADEIVFTKNGSTAIYPWMFSTIPDLLMQYSFHALDGQQLTLRYFRSKSL